MTIRSNLVAALVGLTLATGAAGVASAKTTVSQTVAKTHAAKMAPVTTPAKIKLAHKTIHRTKLVHRTLKGSKIVSRIPLRTKLAHKLIVKPVKVGGLHAVVAKRHIARLTMPKTQKHAMIHSKTVVR